VPAPSLFMSGNDPLRIIRELEHLGSLQVAARMSACPASPSWTRWKPTWRGTWAWSARCRAARSKTPSPGSGRLRAGHPSGRNRRAAGRTRAGGSVAAAQPGTPAAAPAGASAPAHHEAAAETSIRVSVDKVDALINLVGELVITQAMLKQVSQRWTRSTPKPVRRPGPAERNTRDLQEAVIGVRMLPVDAVFRRFPRLVRDLSSRLGKQVRLRTVGEGTELDKGLIEKIADPLVHLVRNSIDHGLEMPDARVAAGKDETGTITLAASHQGGHIVIEVSDDGRGLDRDKILAKAVERGLAVPDNPTDSQVWDLIFQPGFSTADAVTDLSGRGVGMDVVRRNIQALGGEVQIESSRRRHPHADPPAADPGHPRRHDRVGGRRNPDPAAGLRARACSRKPKTSAAWPAKAACCACAANTCRSCR
jgi:two-component system chemotaxis sensor kinase CheA